jgi:hypothetical protein
MKKFISLVLVATMFFVVGCGAKSVKGFQVSKTVAETVLYESRLLQNQGKMDDATFAKVKDLYEKWAVAQNAAIDARIAYLRSGLETDKANLEKWSTVISTCTTGLIAIATQFKFADKVLIGG